MKRQRIIFLSFYSAGILAVLCIVIGLCFLCNDLRFMKNKITRLLEKEQHIQNDASLLLKDNNLFKEVLARHEKEITQSCLGERKSSLEWLSDITDKCSLILLDLRQDSSAGEVVILSAEGPYRECVSFIEELEASSSPFLIHSGELSKGENGDRLKLYLECKNKDEKNV